MKILFKSLQYIFKLLASIFSKMGAQYTYTKLYKYLIRYKFIFIIYKPLKFIFNNIIYFIKLASAIMAILSLFNFSLFYYNFDIIDSINDLINNFINYIKTLYNNWFGNKEYEISEPVEFLSYRKNIKVIDKTIQHPTNNSYWILPLMIVGYGAIYYYNPHINLEEIINPVISKFDDKISSDYVTTFVTGTFIYKFITASISYVTGYKLNPFTGDDGSLSDEDRKNIKEIITNYKGASTYSPTENLTAEEKEEYNTLFPKEEDLNTPKATTSKLPSGNPPLNENPFKKIKIIQYSPNSSEIKIEDWE